MAWRHWLAACLLLVTLTAVGDEDRFSSVIDRTHINADETLTLSVRYQGHVFDEPDFSALEHDFEILSRQHQSRFSFGGNRNETQTRWVLTLSPRETGRLVIPSFTFRGEVSDAIVVEVDEAPAPDFREIFVETALEQDSVHVQQQALLTIKVHTAVPLDNFSASELNIDNARVARVKEEQYSANIDGIRYSVVEWRYAIFPERSGELVIPAVRFSALVPDRQSGYRNPYFRRTGRTVRFNSDESTLDVTPRPGGIEMPHWLPARGVSLNQRWSRRPDQLVVGEPVTRRLTLTAQALTASQLPPLTVTAGDGLTIYPEPPELKNRVDGSGVVGERTETFTIVPTEAGTLTLPPVTVTWWDTGSERLREATLEPITLEVTPATDQPRALSGSPGPATADPEPPGATARWTDGWVYGLFLVPFVLFGLALWWYKRGRLRPPAPAPTGEKAEKAAFEDILKHPQKDLPGLRRAILAWARLRWPRQQVLTLCQVAELAASDDLRAHFRALDSALYSRNGAAEVDIAALREALAEARRGTAGPGEQRGQSLKPLYPH